MSSLKKMSILLFKSRYGAPQIIAYFLILYIALSIAAYRMRCWSYYIVTQTHICDRSGASPTSPTSCYDALTGELHLQDDGVAEFESETSAVFKSGLGDNIIDPIHQGIKVRITKENTRVLYPLKYVKEVFDNFSERNILMTEQETGSDFLKYCIVTDRFRCEEEFGLAVDAMGIPLLHAYGRCCYCESRPFLGEGEEATTVQRGELTCSRIGAIWGAHVFLRSCPIVHGPWHSAFEIVNEPAIESDIAVTVEWWEPPSETKLSEKKSVLTDCENAKVNRTITQDIDCYRLRYTEAGKKTRTYKLTAAQPEISDDESGLTLRILTSYLQNERGYPDISGSTLFVQNFLPSLDDDTCTGSSCLENSLFIPNAYVDLSGTGCDKIGADTVKWASHPFKEWDTFCDDPPGTCMTTQLHAFRGEDALQKLLGIPLSYGPPLVFGQSPVMDVPEATGRDIQTAIMQLQYPLLETHFTTINFQMKVDSITWLRSVVPGLISDITPPPPGHCKASHWDGCPLKVSVINSGLLESTYTIQVPACYEENSTDPTQAINHITPMTLRIPAGEPSVSTHIIKVLTVAPANYTCTIELYDAAFTLLDRNEFQLETGETTAEHSERPISYISVTLEESGFEGDYSLGGIFNFFKNQHDEGGGCDCGLRILCYITNIGSCVMSLLQKIFKYLSIFAIVGLLVCCWPLISVCLKCIFKIIKGGHKTVKAAASSIDKQIDGNQTEAKTVGKPSNIDSSETKITKKNETNLKKRESMAYDSSNV